MNKFLDNLDAYICRIPFIGWIIKRLYIYFKNHIVFTDFIHILLGSGLALIIFNKELLTWGVILLGIALLGHIYAFIKGK